MRCGAMGGDRCIGLVHAGHPQARLCKAQAWLSKKTRMPETPYVDLIVAHQSIEWNPSSFRISSCLVIRMDLDERDLEKSPTDTTSTGETEFTIVPAARKPTRLQSWIDSLKAWIHRPASTQPEISSLKVRSRKSHCLATVTHPIQQFQGSVPSKCWRKLADSIWNKFSRRI
jgi:hypothetical protein